MLDLSIYPGGDLVKQGLEDLAKGTLSESALLVLIARSRLRGMGIDVPDQKPPVEPAEHALYELIEARSASPHSDYNALIQLLVCFANAYAVHHPVD